MRLALVGVSHHQAPVELRERVAVDLEGARALAAGLAVGREAVVLSTCNRTEIYLAGAAEGVEPAGVEPAVEALLRLAAEHAADLAPVLYRFEDESAARHLFRVAAGLDSLVPGEGEILGQVRAAYEAGSPGPFLDRLFRQALTTGRRARLETSIGERPASIPAAAGALAQQVFGELDGRRVVLVGAGRVAELTARNLVSRGAVVVAVANRTPVHGEELARRLAARSVPLEQVAQELPEADVVVASTSAPGLVLHGEAVASGLRARRGRPLLVVDLAVPRDVDPGLGRVDGCYVYDVDDLEAVVRSSLGERRAEAARAERIVAAEAARFREWQASLAVVPAITSLRRWAEDVRAGELARAGARLDRLPESERKLVEVVTAQIVAKLLHGPTVRMKEAAVTPDGVVYADVVRHLFGLGEEDARR